MTLAVLRVFEISVAMAIGFILGRIWQVRCDLEKQRDAPSAKLTNASNTKRD
jgi:hypothetical protein